VLGNLRVVLVAMAVIVALPDAVPGADARPAKKPAAHAIKPAKSAKSKAKPAKKVAAAKQAKAAPKLTAQQKALAKKCAQKAHRNDKACKALRAAQAKRHARVSICGRRYGVAKKSEKVAKFAKRYKAREDLVRAWNGLDAKVKVLKKGKRYVVWKSPHEGVVLQGGVLLADEPDVFAVQRPNRGYGKPLLVETLRIGAQNVQAAHPLATALVVGDLSKEGGGCLPPHKSHRGGLDADVGYYFRGGHQRNWLGLATPDTIDADRTWQLLRVLLATGRLQYAFIDHALQQPLYEAALRTGESSASLLHVFQWPRGLDEAFDAPIRHLKGHADHMHVRLACPEGDPCALDEAATERLRAITQELAGGVANERARSDSRHRPRSGAVVPGAMP
jgi:hypothetical protein